MCIGPRNYLDTADINPRGGIRKRASRFRIQTIKMRSSILLHPDRNEWMDIYPGYRHRVDPINIQNIYLICMNIGYQSRQRKDKVWKKPQLVFLPSFTLLWRRLHLGEMIDKRRFMLLQRGRSSLSLSHPTVLHSWPSLHRVILIFKRRMEGSRWMEEGNLFPIKPFIKNN